MKGSPDSDSRLRAPRRRFLAAAELRARRSPSPPEVHAAGRHAEDQRRDHALRGLLVSGRADGRRRSTKNTIHKNSFNVNRAYINVTGSLSHWFSFRITPDIARARPEPAARSHGQPDVPDQVRLRPGQLRRLHAEGLVAALRPAADALIDYIEGVYRYRFQGATFTRRGRLPDVLRLRRAARRFDLPGELRRRPRRASTTATATRATNDQTGGQQRERPFRSARTLRPAPGDPGRPGTSPDGLLRQRPLLLATPSGSGSSAA